MLTADDLRRVILPPVGVGLRRSSSVGDESTSGRDVEFTLGREAAAEAIAFLGLEPKLIPVGQRGAPVWPDGVVGSITHTAGLALAVAARASDRAAMGIDMERADRHVDARTMRRFCTTAELTLLSEQHHAWLTPLALFCAKEASYKALGRWLPREIGWRDVDFRPDANDTLTGTLSARATRSAPVETVCARITTAGGFVVACVEIPAPGTLNPGNRVPSARAETAPGAQGSR